MDDGDNWTSGRVWEWKVSIIGKSVGEGEGGHAKTGIGSESCEKVGNIFGTAIGCCSGTKGGCWSWT